MACAAGAAGCIRNSGAPIDREGGSTVARVEVVRPARAVLRRTTVQPGQIEPYETTPLYAKIAGYVQQWNVDIGTRVKKRQVLALLSDPELDAEVEQRAARVEEMEARLAQAKAAEVVAQASLTSAQSRLEEVRAGTRRTDADLARWQAEYRRVEQLFKDRAQTGSYLDETRSKLQASESARDELHAQVKSAEAAVHQSRALLDKARSDVTAAAASLKVARFDSLRVQALREYEKIAAPYDGVVTHRHVDVGDLTEPGAHGEPLFIVARDDIVRVTVAVPEMYAAEVNPGDRVQIRLQALAGRTFEGKITRTAWTLDARNRTLRTEIDVPNPGGLLRPGLYASATVVVEEHPDALSVPSSALVRQDDQTFCLAVVNGHVQRKSVQVGLDDGTRAEILSGLDGNESIVKAYASSLVNGQTVTPFESASSKATP